MRTTAQGWAGERNSLPGWEKMSVEVWSKVFDCPELCRGKELISRMEKMGVEVCSKLFDCLEIIF